MKLRLEKHKVILYVRHSLYALFIGSGVGLLGGMIIYCLVAAIPDFLRLDDNSRLSRERLVGIYNEVDLGEDFATVAKKVIDRVDGHDIDVDFHDDGRNAKLRLVLPVSLLWDDWALTLCFADSLLEGMRLGTVRGANALPDSIPAPKGVCT